MCLLNRWHHLHADATDLDLELHSYERPLAVSPFWDSRVSS